MPKAPSEIRKERRKPKAIKGGRRRTLVAEGMLVEDTPVEYYEEYDLWVKREDLSCPPPGPPFSKTRGVYARVKAVSEDLVGVLDTFHSQAGHAVARACQVLGKRCLNYYPKYKADAEGDAGLREPQLRAREIGAELRPLPAGRSCILFHAARKDTEKHGGYMMPNALKLEESVSETAKEVATSMLTFDSVILPSSSGTIAAGVIRGLASLEWEGLFVIHLGYSRSHDAVLSYLEKASGVTSPRVLIVDEGYSYKDKARDGETPPWPCNEYYDLKAFRWFLEKGDADELGKTLLWNIG